MLNNINYAIISKKNPLEVNMKKITSIIFSLFFAFCLNAQDITEQEQIKTLNIETEVVQEFLGEYGYIQPVATEETPIRIVIPEPINNDLDSDGVLNENDRCPNTTIGAEVDLVGCLILPDDDNDGVPNKDDKCPNTKEGTPVDYRGCEKDSDDDGVVDSKDQCPNTGKYFNVDGYGCPQTATLKVNFASGKSNIDQKLINDLQNFALFLKENKGYDLIIYGYTDSIGSDVSNQKLSLDRANAIKEVLSRYGIDSAKITTIGKGEADPIADNKTKDGRAQNRRIEVELIK